MACTAIVSWINNSFNELEGCSAKPRQYLQKTGLNFTNSANALPILASSSVQTIIVSSRNPISRMASAFVNKFHVYGRQIISNDTKMERFSRGFADKLIKWRHRRRNDGTIDVKSGSQISNDTFSLKEFFEFIIDKGYKDPSIDYHFKPAVNEQNELQIFLDLSQRFTSCVMMPLRVENFNSDLSSINSVLSIPDFLPPKFNATRLPDEGWSLCDDPECLDFSVSDLQQRRIIPTAQSIQAYFDINPDFRNAFEKCFEYDYLLCELVNKLSYRNL